MTTITTPNHEHTARPHVRLDLHWLLTGPRRLRARWQRVYKRGQLGPRPGEVRHDRIDRHYDRILPRIY